MGGTALGYTSRRIDTAELLRIDATMASIFPELSPKLVQSYRSKDDHGDVDFIVIGSAEDVRSLINERFDHPTMYPNNQFISFDYTGVQVDFICSANAQEQELNLVYTAWNDLGNFLGRTARCMGFKYGHDGLKYVLRLSDHHTEELVVSTDIEKILTFLGHDYERWKRGFDTKEQVFDYAMDSPYFNSQYFSLEDQTHQDRTRNKKRKMYQGFMAYLEQLKVEPRPKMTEEERAVLLVQANDFFGTEIIARIAGAVQAYRDAEDLKAKFNGDLVKSWTGAEGKQLGQIINSFKEQVAMDWQEFVLQPPEAIKDQFFSWFFKSRTG